MSLTTVGAVTNDLFPAWRTLPEPPPPRLVGTYEVEVDYDFTQAETLELAGYRWNGVCASEGLEPIFVTPDRVGQQKVMVSLWSFGNPVCMSYARLFFAAGPNHPIDFWTLCMLGHAHPAITKRREVIGLGSVFGRSPTVNGGQKSQELWAPYLEMGVERSITLTEFSDLAEEYTVFATVPKLAL